MTDNHRTDEPITVEAALALDPLRAGVPEVLGGAESLANAIRWVHSGEWLEMASVLRGGELLLSTGMGLPDDPATQRRFITSLADRGIAGLVIELHTAIDAVPKAVVAEAQACGLPLIALHREIPFVEVTEALHREIVNRQATALTRADQAHRRFTELMLDGAGVTEVLAALTDLLGNPVVVEKADEGVLYHDAHTAGDGAVRAAWDAVTRRLPQAPAHISVPVTLRRGRTWGTVSALGLDGPLRRDDRAVLERGATVIALAMLQRDGEQGLAARQRGQFIARLTGARGPVDEREASAMAAELGFDRRALLRLPIVAVHTYRWSPDVEAAADAPWVPIWREVTRELAGTRTPAVVGLLGGEGLAVVVALRSAAERPQIADRLGWMLRRAAAARFEDPKLVLCVGGVSRSWTELGGELSNALALSHAVAHAPERPWFDSTVPSIEGLLWALRDDEPLRRFVARRLEPILAHDRDHRTQLVETVRSYCDHGGRITETARDLHLHRQSLYKRLGHVEQLLGEDLSDPDTRLGLHLAVRAYGYLDSAKAAGETS